MNDFYDVDLHDSRGLFHYFIVYPHQTRIPTFFNEFSRELIPIGLALSIIECLPTHILECQLSWPLSSDWMLDYQIDIISENELKANKDLFKRYTYGCIFFLPGNDNSTILDCIGNIELPIVTETTPQTYHFSDERLVKSLYEFWETKSFTGFTWDLDKTNFPTLSEMTTISRLPLVAVKRKLRGLYSNSREGLNIAVPKNNIQRYENEEGEKIASEIKLLIAEKLLTSILSCYLNEDNETYISFQEIFKFTDEDIQLILKKNWNVYNNVAISIKENEKINMLSTDIVLLAHSANYPMVKYKNNLLEKKKQIPNKILKAICDADGYYPILNEKVIQASSEEKTKFQFDLVDGMIDDRKKEIYLINSMYLLYALGRRIPYIPSKHIPASEFYDEASVISQISVDMEDRNMVPRFNEGMRKLKQIINNAYSNEVIDIINIHSEHIKLISDLPLEWMEIGGIPLFLQKTVSRLPITSGDDLIRYHMRASLEYELAVDTVKILIVNTLRPDDMLFKYGKALFHAIQSYFAPLKVEIKYEEIESKNSFKQIMEDFKPTIFIYYGHGDYDNRAMKGTLDIRRMEKIEEEDIIQLKWKPLITILGACKTHVMNGAYQNIANVFLRTGSLSVLGTFFPVDGKLAFIYINNLMKLLAERLMGIDFDGHYETWADIIQKTQRMIYHIEPIISFEKHLRQEGISEEKLLKNFFAYCDKHELYGMQSYIHRDCIYEEILGEYPSFKKKFSRLKDTSIIPLSLYFSSLGNPERIKFRPSAEGTEWDIERIKSYFEDMFS